jgi:Prion-inhibition and propagation
MAEVIGVIASALAIVQLCIRGFDFIQAAQQQEADLRKLTIKLSIEKFCLYTWGETLGLAKQPKLEEKIPLQHCKSADTVVETLRLVLELLDDSQKTREKYGCEKIDVPHGALLLPETEQSKLVQQLNASFSNFRIRGKTESM